MNIPFMFLFLDSESEYEKGVEYIYREDKLLKFTGSDFANGKLTQP